MTRLQQDQQFGAQGFDVIMNTTAQYPPQGTRWFAIKALTDAVIAELGAANMTLNGTTSNTALAGITIKTGDILYGTISAIKLTSGSVAAFKTNIA